MEFKLRVKETVQNQRVPQTKGQESAVNSCSDVDLGQECVCWKFGKYLQISSLEPSPLASEVFFTAKIVC